MSEQIYTLRNISKNDLKVPNRPKSNCIGFNYNFPKLFNLLLKTLRKITTQNMLKTEIKMIEDNMVPLIMKKLKKGDKLWPNKSILCK